MPLKSARLVSGEENVKINGTGKEGVNQIRALLWLCELITNVNIPNQGPIPKEIYPLISRVCAEQEVDRFVFYLVLQWN